MAHSKMMLTLKILPKTFHGSNLSCCVSKNESGFGSKFPNL